MDNVLAVILLWAIASTMWTAGFVWASFRVKGMWERLLCAAIVLPGVLVMVATYLILALVVSHWPGFISDLHVNPPREGEAPFLWGYLGATGTLAAIVAVRRFRARGRSRV